MSFDVTCEAQQSAVRGGCTAQVGLKLTGEQQDTVLELRERVMFWLNKAAEARAEAYALFPPLLMSSVAEVIQVRPDGAHSHQPGLGPSKGSLYLHAISKS